MRIAFLTYPHETWQAAATTSTSILAALQQLGADAPRISLVTWNGSSPEDYPSVRPFADQLIRMAYYLKPPPLASIYTRRPFRRLWARILKKPSVLLGLARTDLLRQSGVDCVFSMPFDLRHDFGLPLIIWIPDFQHLRLPEMFSPEERKKRDENYRREIQTATLLMVKTQAIRRDLEEFAPEHAAKARVLPIVTPVPPTVYDQDPASVAARYHLPSKFFYLPNQFWKHKNHSVVLEALRILKARSIFAVVVCSGSTLDERHPLYFSELLNQISRGNLREQFIILGRVPYEDVLLLMRQSLAVMNPSLFEGFGLSVAESISLGKRVLVSDLPALREQDAPGAVYFNPRDAEELAQRMQEIWESTAPGPDRALEEAARAVLPRRQMAFARAFMDMVKEAISRFWGA